MDRKSFVRKGFGASIGAAFLPGVMSACAQQYPDPLPISVVKEFVTAGHKDINRVKEMLEEFPTLIYSRYDWGNGDFEEAIEGAGHLGDKEIPNYLIAKGARVNLFVLTMLGKTNLVKPILQEYPQLIMGKGAHGFTLLHHAEEGGDDSEDLLDYLKSKGLKETKINL